MLSPSPLPLRRLRLDIRGAVQGVGFRPHVYRLAREMALAGWIVNDTDGIRIEVEGDTEALERFAARLEAAPPPRARITGTRATWLRARGEAPFHIRHSEGRGAPTVAVLPDLATCPDCLADVGPGGGRREGYAFTNCTNCGPRLSIVRDLPYDRPLTTMAGFDQCPECLAEYEDPANRRFHAQPNACPSCGPHLAFMPVGGTGEPAVDDAAALAAAARAIREGRVVAVKGLGGFHLVADATNEAAVVRLRARKGREAKPLAVMVGDARAAATLAEVTPEARALLESPEAPIVLLPARRDTPLAPSVAPGNPRVGVMLAYTPLHHLLLGLVDGPVVATSGNRSDEPICVSAVEALERLDGIADAYLVHDRPIQRAVDDSVAAVMDGSPRILRRARGYAPLPLPLPTEAPPLLAVGGHLKNTVAVTRGRQAFLSQHIGDLDTLEAQRAFRQAVADYLRLYRVEPAAVVHDLHPDYASTRWVESGAAPDVPRVGVQHHHAHLASLLVETGIGPDAAPVLGVTWDGTGWGPDGTVWGGEFLLGGYVEAPRVARLRTFLLPGGEQAVREPRRAALGLLLEAGLDQGPAGDTVATLFTPAELRVLRRSAERGVNTPRTSSAGRLFDALAALLGLRTRSRFEGEAAMLLEYAADPGEAGAYPVAIARDDDLIVLDWEPLVRAVLSEVGRVPTAAIAARIHNGLVEGIAAVAERVGAATVGLSGGCFQNHLLLGRASASLAARGHRVLTHRAVPPGDGGIALGQAAVAAVRLVGGPRSASPVLSPSPPDGV